MAGSGYAHPDGLWASFASTGRHRREFRGGVEGLGWCAPVYGQLVQSRTVRISEMAAAPMSLITVIAAGDTPIGLSVEHARVVVDDNDGWHRAAATVSCGTERLLVLFTTPGTDPGTHNDGRGDRRSMQRLPLANGEFITDARVVLLSVRPDAEPIPLALLDSTGTVWTGRPGLPTAQRTAGSRAEDRRDPLEKIGGRDAQPRRA
jgi:hypothetical protein